MLTGYPPCDKALREWLLDLGADRQKVAKRLQCFLTSLLDVTLRRLKAIEYGDTFYNCESVQERQSLLADRFRENMTEGTTFGEANEYREKFFNEVIRRANQVGFSGWSSPFGDGR